MLYTLAAALLPLAAPTASTPGTPRDWPQYMGPDRTAVARWPSETFTWPSEGPRVVWRVSTGPGFGGAAIADGEVFLFDREKDSGDVLRVFDLANGEELWSAGYEVKGRLSYDGSRTVPSVVGRRVFTSSGFGPISCFDRDEHELVWSVDAGADLDGAQPDFGWCSHPTIVGDLVIAAALGTETGLVALDQETGEIKWRTGYLGLSHSSPVLVHFGGREQLIFNARAVLEKRENKPMPATIWSFDPATGEQLWKHDMALTRRPIPPPVVVDDDRLFVTGGYRSGSVLLHAQRTVGGATTFTEDFRSTRGAQIHAPIVYGEHIYLLVNENWTDGRRNHGEGGLMCFDLDGNERWRTGAEPNFGRGGLVQVADALLVQDGYKGDLVAVRATPNGFEELGRFAPFEVVDRDGQLWAPLAVSGTRVLMRSQNELVCVELAP